MVSVEEGEARTIAKMVTKIKVEGSPPAMTVAEDSTLAVEDLGLEVVMDRDGAVVLASPTPIETMTSRTTTIHQPIRMAKNAAVSVRVTAGEVASAHAVETEIRVDLAVGAAEEAKIRMMNRRTKKAEVGYNNWSGAHNLVQCVCVPYLHG